MKKKKWYTALFWVFLAVFAVSAGYAVYDRTVRAQRKQAYEELADEVKKETAVAAASPASTHTQAPTKAPEPTDAPKAEIPVDFEALKEKNPDIYAWIEIPGTKVDYPVVQSPDDDAYYLDHTVEGAQGYPGSIYTESLNKTDFSDRNTVIYGHNMKDESMFGGLKHYVDPSYMREHSQVIIYTPEHIYTYQIFAAVTYDDRHILKAFDFAEDAEFAAFVESLEAVKNIASRVDAGVEVTAEDRIVTLSTCNGNSAQRFLVTAVLTGEE